MYCILIHWVVVSAIRMLYCILIHWVVVSGNADDVLHPDPLDDGIGQCGRCASPVADGGHYQAKWMLYCILIRLLKYYYSPPAPYLNAIG